MIRKISASCALGLLISAAIPGAGCSSSDSPGGSAGATSSAGASAVAGSSSMAGSGGQPSASAGATASAGSTASAGASSAGASAAGATSSGGTSNGGSSSGGSSSGGASKGGASSGGANAGGSGSGGAPAGAGCEKAGLVWKSANKTNYTSYPEPGSDECVKYSGCLYEGLFAACDKKQTKAWVQAHNIAAVFPMGNLALHDICIKSGNKTLVVTVYDTCGDDDCDGCCSENKGNKDALVDLESFTNERWGLQDGAIQWADLGPTSTTGCVK